MVSVKTLIERRIAMATVQDVLSTAEATGGYGSREGVYITRPPVMVRKKTSGGIFPVVAIDVQIGNSEAGGFLLFAGQEKEEWYPADNYEVPRRMVWTCPKKECNGNKKAHLCAGFCTECGTALEQVPLGFVTVNTPCPECKARVVFPEDKFCSACGAQLKGESR